MSSFASSKSGLNAYYTEDIDGGRPDDVYNRRNFELDTINLVERTKTGQSGTDPSQTLIPAPTHDPRDPLNLKRNRKIAGVFFLCFFGAMAAAAELILGAMLPVFVLEYAGINPQIIEQFTKLTFPAGTNPLALLNGLPGPPIEKVYLLGSLPVLMIGLSNLVMIPVATAVGRRPVVLSCGVLAVAGCIWSGNSRSLDSHLAARCLQAVGAGTVESLIPFIISDLTYSHERNSWMSFVFATQGIIIVGLGFATPYVIVKLSWRWLYFITAIGAAIFLVGVYFFLPETRYQRSLDELSKLFNALGLSVLTLPQMVPLAMNVGCPMSLVPGSSTLHLRLGPGSGGKACRYFLMPCKP